MRIALVITPLNESNLRLAKQMGVTDVVTRFPGQQPEALAAVKDRIEAAGLRLSVIEGYLPMERTVLGEPGRDEEISQVSTLIRSMGAADVPVLCYNFMSILDATRTSYVDRDRGEALVSSFDVDRLPGETLDPEATRTVDQFWDSLKYFLERVLPVAEESGVALAMHPDDPPGLAMLHGQPRIMGSIAQFERLVDLVPSPANGICFCQGCFSEMGVDVPAAIRRLGPHIRYVHFRDVVGCTPRFRETFHDCGQTDMAAAMRAYRDIGFEGVMRPDHVPLLEGESGEATGYTMLGRLFAVGYMRGLIHAVESEPANTA